MRQDQTFDVATQAPELDRAQPRAVGTVTFALG